MNSSIVTPPTDAALETFLPLARVRGLCFVNNSRQDDELKDYRRTAYEDGEFEARASFLPQTIRAVFNTPYGSLKNFGLEGRVVDADGVQRAIRLPKGPIISVTSVTFLDSGGNEQEVVVPADYALESSKFLRWGSDFSWSLNDIRPTFAITYEAGFPEDHPKLASLRVAVGEVIAAKWDARGTNYKMPTTAVRVFHSLRTSRTYVPGATA